MRLDEARNLGPPARTLSRVELKTCSHQNLRRRRPHLQRRYQRQCSTLEDLLRHGRDSSNGNTLAVLNAVQILHPSEEPRTTASCSTWFRSASGQQVIQESVAQLRHLDRAACVLCGTISSRRCHRCSHCKRDIMLAILFRTDNLDTRTQCPLARPPLTILPTALSQSRRETFRRQPTPELLHDIAGTQNATSSCLPIFAEPQQWPSRAAQSHATPLRGRESLEGAVMPLSLPPAAG